MKNALLTSAKAKLDMHKTLGQRSKLSIFQVAELLDFISGKNDFGQLPAGLFPDGAFSAN